MCSQEVNKNHVSALHAEDRLVCLASCLIQSLRLVQVLTLCLSSPKQYFPGYSAESVNAAMDELVQQEDDDCPELVPIDTNKQIPVTIITGYLGTRLRLD